MDTNSIGAASEPSLTFYYESIGFGGRDITNLYDIILDIMGVFYIEVDGQLLYQQHYFSLIEFILDLERWLRLGGLDEHVDFSYTSMDNAYEGLVQFIAVEEDGWRVVSVNEIYSETRVFSSKTIETLSHGFIQQVKNDIKANFDLEGFPNWKQLQLFWFPSDEQK